MTTPATTPADGVTEPSIYAQGILSDTEALRVLLKNMLDEDQFDRADNLLRAIEDGIEEAMSDAYAQGEQEAKDRATPSPDQTKATLAAMVDAVRWWAKQEDGMPDEVAPAFNAAMLALGWSYSQQVDLDALATTSPGKAPEPVAPSDTVVVPIHPTKEMREAGAKIGNQGWDFAHHTWRTMLLHAPVYASPGKADAEDAARWRHARKAFWINGDPADVLCSSDADKAIDADMERDKQ